MLADPLWERMLRKAGRQEQAIDEGSVQELPDGGVGLVALVGLIPHLPGDAAEDARVDRVELLDVSGFRVQPSRIHRYRFKGFYTVLSRRQFVVNGFVFGLRIVGTFKVAFLQIGTLDAVSS